MKGQTIGLIDWLASFGVKTVDATRVSAYLQRRDYERAKKILFKCGLNDNVVEKILSEWEGILLAEIRRVVREAAEASHNRAAKGLQQMMAAFGFSEEFQKEILDLLRIPALDVSAEKQPIYKFMTEKGFSGDLANNIFSTYINLYMGYRRGR